MSYDFDRVIDRRNTDSLKYDFAQQRGKPKGILPLWVADMDFQCPPCVLEALEDRCKHGIFGYSDTGEEYDRILHNWFATHHNWDIARKWLVKTPGVVYAIAMAVHAFTQKGDSVLIQPPVYYPFSAVVRDNQRNLVNNQLVYQDGRYTIDYIGFEATIIQNGVKLFILCSPHNPVGRVWTEQELIQLGEICLRHGVIVVSDEIHADFVYPGHRHIVFSSLKPEFEAITITCTAPTKTFNLAGIQCSNIFIPNDKLRQKFRNKMDATGYSQPNVMGITACMSAYRDGEGWLSALMDYLRGNLLFLHEYLLKNLPSARLIPPEGTYLVWVDFSGYSLEDKKLDELITKAGVWLDGGTMFGVGGGGFQRINMACSRTTLKAALDRIALALERVLQLNEKNNVALDVG